MIKKLPDSLCSNSTPPNKVRLRKSEPNIVNDKRKSHDKNQCRRPYRLVQKITIGYTKQLVPVPYRYWPGGQYWDGKQHYFLHTTPLWWWCPYQQERRCASYLGVGPIPCILSNIGYESCMQNNQIFSKAWCSGFFSWSFDIFRLWVLLSETIIWERLPTLDDLIVLITGLCPTYIKQKTWNQSSASSPWPWLLCVSWLMNSLGVQV